MTAFFRTLADGLRVILLRHPRNNQLTASAGTFFTLVICYLIADVIIAMTYTAMPWQLVPAGILGVLTDSLLTLTGAWVLVGMARRNPIGWSIASIMLGATIMLSLVLSGLTHGIHALVGSNSLWLVWSLNILSNIWWPLILIVLARSLIPSSSGRALMAALFVYAISTSPWWWLPTSPLLIHGSAQVTETLESTEEITNLDALVEPDQPPRFDAEAVMYNQAHLLNQAIAKLKPRAPDKMNLYVLAFAGDGEEDVFRNEAEYTKKLFEERFDAAGHVLLLQNNPATVETHPLASLTNLTLALQGIAKKMNLEEDVLMLFITTHGSSDLQLLIELDPLPLNQIGPNELADALRTAPGIRWKVLVINACYSGGFIDTLRDDSTMVITSARTDRTSFGCGIDSDITYFGKAFFVQGLNQTASFHEAFTLAAKSIATWENDEHEPHSEPQLATNPRIEAKLAQWNKQLKLGAPVPFSPANSDQAGLTP